ncbi:hypothetical protein ACTQ5F_08010 [Jeotgalibaca porci]|uniref:hypothetical protein n=1 Tax=Jeotgalibaca porci TaxID=1868793 RepID=UPI003F8F9A6A
MTNKTMQILHGIEAELDGILLERQKELEVIFQEVETAKTIEDEAKVLAVKAKQDNKPKVFAQANQDLRTAQDIKTFHLNKIEEMEAEPFVSEAEYNHFTRMIKDELDHLNNESKEKAGALLKELVQIKEDFEPVIQEGQELLHKLQHTLYKNRAETTTATGTKVHLDSLENKYRDYSLINWLKHTTNGHGALQLQQHAEKGEDK